MKLINVLNSEFREEALRRWDIAREVAKRVNGVIYGSMAAMVTEGLSGKTRKGGVDREFGILRGVTLAPSEAKVFREDEEW